MREKYNKACEGYDQSLNEKDWARCIAIVELANNVLATDISAVVYYYCGKPMLSGELIEHNNRRIEWLRKMQGQPSHA